jgi:hypothetical protein
MKKQKKRKIAIKNLTKKIKLEISETFLFTSLSVQNLTIKSANKITNIKQAEIIWKIEIAIHQSFMDLHPSKSSETSIEKYRSRNIHTISTGI